MDYYPQLNDILYKSLIENGLIEPCPCDTELSPEKLRYLELVKITIKGMELGINSQLNINIRILFVKIILTLTLTSELTSESPSKSLFDFLLHINSLIKEKTQKNPDYV